MAAGRTKSDSLARPVFPGSLGRLDPRPGLFIFQTRIKLYIWKALPARRFPPPWSSVSRRLFKALKIDRDATVCTASRRFLARFQERRKTQYPFG